MISNILFALFYREHALSTVRYRNNDTFFVGFAVVLHREQELLLHSSNFELCNPAKR